MCSLQPLQNKGRGAHVAGVTSHHLINDIGPIFHIHDVPPSAVPMVDMGEMQQITRHLLDQKDHMCVSQVECHRLHYPVNADGYCTLYAGSFPWKSTHAYHLSRTGDSAPACYQPTTQRDGYFRGFYESLFTLK